MLNKGSIRCYTKEWENKHKSTDKLTDINLKSSRENISRELNANKSNFE